MSTLGDIKSLYESGYLDDSKMIRLVRLGTLGNAVGITTAEFEEATGKKLEDVISLDDAKTLQHGTVNGKRETSRNVITATYDNDEFEVNRTSQINLTSVASAAIIAIQSGAADTKFTYRSATNTDHEFTATQILELALVVVKKVQEIYDASWTLKNKIDDATTVDDVFSVLSNTDSILDEPAVTGDSSDSTDTTDTTAA